MTERIVQWRMASDGVTIEPPVRVGAYACFCGIQEYSRFMASRWWKPATSNLPAWNLDFYSKPKHGSSLPIGRCQNPDWTVPPGPSAWTGLWMYPRFIERRIREALADTPAVILNGPRQSGKTTLARRLAGPDWTYLTLDDATLLNAARSDPVGFVRGLDRAVIEEVQLAPDLLPAVKRSIDEDRRPGRFLLRGQPTSSPYRGSKSRLPAGWRFCRCILCRAARCSDRTRRGSSPLPSRAGPHRLRTKPSSARILSRRFWPAATLRS